MNESPAKELPQPPGSRLPGGWQRWSAELDGFPVSELLDAFIPADRSAHVNAYPLIDTCIASWIKSLDQTIGSYTQVGDEAHRRLLARQLDAREALVQLRAMFAPPQRPHT